MPDYLFDSSGQPRVEDVDQGQHIGDCWLLASLGAIVCTAPGRQLIRRHARHLVGPVYEIDLWSHPDLTGRAEGWETYRINASRLHDQATPRPIRSAGGRGHGEAIEPCEYFELDLVDEGQHLNALGTEATGRETPLRADGTPNASTVPILWVVLYETAMMHHLDLHSYEALGNLDVHGRRFGPNPAPLAMRTVMGPGTRDLLEEMFAHRRRGDREASGPSTLTAFFNSSNILDVWTFIRRALRETPEVRDVPSDQYAAVTAATQDRFTQRYQFCDRDRQGREIGGLGDRIVHLAQGHVYTVFGSCHDDPQAVLAPTNDSAGHHFFVRVRNPWGTDDQYYRELEICHAVPMRQFVRLFTGVQVFSIPGASSDSGQPRTVRVSQHGRPEPSRGAGSSPGSGAATRRPPRRSGDADRS